MLGESGRVVCTKGGVAIEEHVGDHGSGDKMNLVVYASVASVFEDFWGDVAERAGEKGELLVGRVKTLALYKMRKWMRIGCGRAGQSRR